MNASQAQISRIVTIALILTALVLVGFRVPSAQASTSDTGVNVVNKYRALAGLPGISADTQMRSGAAKHSQYMVRTGTIAHSQNPSSVHYTPEGDKAARESNLKVSSGTSMTVRSAVDGLMTAPFHGLGFIDPRLRRSGSALFQDPNASRWRSGFTMNVTGGLQSSVPSGTTFPILWPGAGSTTALNRYPGNEMPDPLTPCPGFSAPTGLPIMVQLQSYEPVQSASVRGPDGASLQVCTYDSRSYTNSNGELQGLGRSVMSSRNAIFVIPRSPLQNGAHQVRVVTSGRTMSWSFTVATGGSSPTPAPAPIPTKTPEIRSIDSACPASLVPHAGFLDVLTTAAHARPISCVTWRGIASGTSLRTYSPSSTVTRGQMATFIANTIRASGGSLPLLPLPQFSDTLLSPHAHAIHQLAQVGIVQGTGNGRFSPNEPVTRAQMATFLVRAHEHRTSRALPRETGWFVDSTRSPHATNIDKAATAGLTGGVAPGQFGPRRDVRRDVMASFVARTLDSLIAR